VNVEEAHKNEKSRDLKLEYQKRSAAHKAENGSVATTPARD
jgi:hypothetical protein